MNFMIIDDDKSIRTILGILIRQNNLGSVVAELDHGQNAVSDIMFYHPDVVLIDLLLPEKDGIEIIDEINQKGYKGKVVMVSCVEDEEMISRAYQKGIAFYINKPINSIETISVLRNVIKMIELERFMSQIKRAVQFNDNGIAAVNTQGNPAEHSIEKIFTDIGIIGLSGTDEIKEVLMTIHRLQKSDTSKKYHLKNVYEDVCTKLYPDGNAKVNQKNMEQRIRRTIQKSLSNIAEMGCEDYYDPVFTKYANVLFDFKQVRQEMQHIKDPKAYAGKINTKKFMEGILSRVD